MYRIYKHTSTSIDLHMQAADVTDDGTDATLCGYVYVIVEYVLM